MQDFPTAKNNLVFYSKRVILTWISYDYVLKKVSVWHMIKLLD